VEERSKKYQEKKHYDQFQKYLNGLFDKKEDIDITQIIEQIQVIEQFVIDKKRTLGLFYHPIFYWKYISKNVEQLIGYTQQEVYDGGLMFAFKKLYWKQLSLPLKVNKWGTKFLSQVSHLPRNKEVIVFYCGIKLKNKQGELRTCFAKQKILGITDDANPKVTLSYVEIEDITAIYKQDLVWSRMIAKHEESSHVRVFFSQGQKKESPDLLSEREIEILRLVAEKKDSLEISKTLGISKNTVDRHRKNMIARAGVVDMTSLIYLCRMCQLI